MPTIKSTIMKNFGVFAELCDRDFDLAAYIGPTIVKEFSDEDLSKRVYKIKESTKAVPESITMFDLIIIAEYCMRFKDRIRHNDATYRQNNFGAFNKLAKEISYNFEVQKIYKNLLKQEIGIGICMIFESVCNDLTSNNYSAPSKNAVNTVAFGSEIYSIREGMCAKTDEDKSLCKNALRLSIVKLFYGNNNFEAILDEKMSSEVDSYGKPVKVHPYSWDEFIHTLSEVMSNHDARPDDIWYKVLAYYNCCCFSNENKFEFLKKFASGGLVEKSIYEMMEAERSAEESMSDVEFLESFISKE